MKIQNLVRGIAATGIAAAMVLGTSVAANATEEYDEALGLTEAEYVAAAVEIGTPADVAHAAWDDEDFRYKLVIYLEEEETIISDPVPITAKERQFAQEQGITAAAAASTQRTVERSFTGKNGFNADAIRLTVKKTFTFNGSRVWPGTITVTPWASPVGGYYYSGITYSHDSYFHMNGNSNGGHQTERHATFNATSPIPAAKSIYIRIKNHYNGSSAMQGGSVF